MHDGAGPFHVRTKPGDTVGFLILFAAATAVVIWLLVVGD